MEYVFNSMIIATDISAYLPSAELSGVKSLCGLCVQKLSNFSKFSQFNDKGVVGSSIYKLIFEKALYGVLSIRTWVGRSRQLGSPKKVLQY